MEYVFRVWCKNKNEWETHQTFLTNDGILLHSSLRQLLPLNKDTHIISFYTGINDKNDKMIFAGDVVKRGDLIQVVKYHHGAYNIAIFDEDILEVIGNVFDNPKLEERL